MPHFFFFPPILDSTEAGAFLFVTSWNTVPEERRSLLHFHMFVFLRDHFTAFGVLKYVMNAVSVCIADTKLELCFIYFLYNEPKFSLVKKVVRVVHQL